MKIIQYIRQRKEIIVLTVFLVFTVACSDGDILKEQDEQPVSEKPVEEILRDTVDLSAWPVAFGVNYNEQLQFIDFNDLDLTQTTWVRGFIDFFQLYDSPDKLHTDEKISNYLLLQQEGYKTILSIKWNFKGRGESLPEENSIAFKAYMNFLVQILEKLWYQTDLLVIGNEPFIETRIAERDQRLVNFYIAVTREVMQFRNRHPDWYVPLFIGAFNNLYDTTWQTAAVNSLLSFANKEPGVAGIDLHIHHFETEQIEVALNFVSNQLRDNQKILITEFSLMKQWKAHLKDTVPESFAKAWKLDTSWKNYQYIDATLKNPRQEKEWYSFLQHSSWFESRKHYLKEAHSIMIKNPYFLCATYAIRQSFPFNLDFTANHDPWVLNGLFANRTIEPDSLSGRNQFNYSFIDDFIDLQNDMRQ